MSRVNGAGHPPGLFSKRGKDAAAVDCGRTDGPCRDADGGRAGVCGKNATNYEAKSGPYPNVDGSWAALTFYDYDDPQSENGKSLLIEGVQYETGLKGVSYDLETNTLILDNFREPGFLLSAFMMGDDFTVRVKGTCELLGIEVTTGEYAGETYGGYTETLLWGGSLNIAGTGSLTVNERKDERITWGISLWGEGSEALLKISKSVTVHSYGDEHVEEAGFPRSAIAIYRSAGFKDSEAVTIGDKPLGTVYPKYAITGFEDESEDEMDLKNYWSKSNEVWIKGTGKTKDDFPGKEPEDKRKEQTLTVKDKYTKTYGDDKFYLDVKSSGNGMPVYSTDDSDVVEINESGKVTIKGTGTAKVTVYALETEAFKASETKTITITVNKAANPLAVKGKTAKIKYSKVKKKAQKLAVSKVLTFKKKGKGKVTYKKVSGNKKITINKKTGKVTVKKGLKKGTYKVKIKVKAAGNASYKASASKKVTFKIKVR